MLPQHCNFSVDGVAILVDCFASLVGEAAFNQHFSGARAFLVSVFFLCLMPFFVEMGLCGLAGRAPTTGGFRGAKGYFEILAHKTLAQNIDSIVPTTVRHAMTVTLIVRFCTQTFKAEDRIGWVSR